MSPEGEKTPERARRSVVAVERRKEKGGDWGGDGGVGGSGGLSFSPDFPLRRREKRRHACRSAAAVIIVNQQQQLRSPCHRRSRWRGEPKSKAVVQRSSIPRRRPLSLVHGRRELRIAGSMLPVGGEIHTSSR
nr:hypothetical protein Itr_chr04CG25230 [Ipomoea trifida]